MAIFPVIERYRSELRRQAYVRPGDEAMDEMRRRSANAHQSSAIEDIHPTPELKALFDMLLEERAPTAVCEPYVMRYIAEQIVPADRALAMRKAV